ncbi:hypothetical protein C8R45DRAFT_1112290 [Mycena sanguinolenta]|nr:hypothetical protein C8R45DRAFT_1112290 [Mycena sanguinolenta]
MEMEDIVPLTHAVPEAQRLRMRRSIRKLTAVLGETPVIEVSQSPRRRLASASLSSLRAPHIKPQSHGSTFAHASDGHRGSLFVHASATLSSLVLPFHKHTQAGALLHRQDVHSHPPDHPRPSLVVRVPHTPPPKYPLFEDSPQYESPLSIHTPSSSDSPFPPDSPLPSHSPFSSNFSPIAESPSPEPDRRRLHLAKISRTLGENVPPEMVSCEPAPIHIEPAPIHIRRRRQTILTKSPHFSLTERKAEVTVTLASTIPSTAISPPTSLWLLRTPRKPSAIARSRSATVAYGESHRHDPARPHYAKAKWTDPTTAGDVGMDVEGMVREMRPVSG